VCSAPASSDAHAAAVALAERIGPGGRGRFEVLGPAPLFALRGKARSQLVVKAHERTTAIRAVGEAVDALARARRLSAASVSVDVDPQ
jgi:primosomal protein N'